MTKVFLSSTSRDLREYRDAAILACNELGLIPVAMEFFEAMGVGATAGSLAKLDEAEVYLGFFAHRYGYIEPGHTASVTELEFDHASARGLECLCFLVDPKQTWPREHVEQVQLAHLQRFKDRLCQGRIVRWFRSPEDLLHQAYRALEGWLERTGIRPRGPRQLPSPPADFLDRDADLARLEQRVASGTSVIGVHGLGGTGKTAFALKLAERLALRHRDGQVFLDLQGMTQPLPWQEAMGHVIHAFLPEHRLPESDRGLAALYRTVLGGKRVLLLLDNAAGPLQVSPLLPPSGCSLLVTSRRCFLIEGLEAHDLDALPRADAVALLRSMAPRVGEETAEAIAEQCGDLPLAIRLAGAALAVRRDLDAEDYLERLRAARLRALDGVAASVRLSEEQLSGPLRERWRELAVLVGGFEAGWTTRVWGVDIGTADAWLGTLLEHSLLEWDVESRFYRLHDLVRDYAREQLSGEVRVEAEHRHAVYFRDLLHEIETVYLEGGERMAEAVRRLDRMWGNAQAGYGWAQSRMSGDHEAAHLCVSYPETGIYLLSLRLHPRIRIAWFETAAAAARRLGDRPREAAALGNLGLACAALGHLQQAIGFFEQHLAIARAMGDRHGEAADLGNLGLAYATLGRPQLALELHQQHLAIARELGDRRGEGIARGNLGDCCAALGQAQQALQLYQQQRAIAREIGDRHMEENALGSLGAVCADLGRLQLALEFDEQQLVMARAIGDRQGEASASWQLGLHLAQLSPERLSEAIPLMEFRVRFEEDIGHADVEKHAAEVEKLRQDHAARSRVPAGHRQRGWIGRALRWLLGRS
jgi:tetratricopeptide (TPR) repeat protein